VYVIIVMLYLRLKKHTSVAVHLTLYIKALKMFCVDRSFPIIYANPYDLKIVLSVHVLTDFHEMTTNKKYIGLILCKS